MTSIQVKFRSLALNNKPQICLKGLYSLYDIQLPPPLATEEGSGQTCCKYRVERQDYNVDKQNENITKQNYDITCKRNCSGQS